MGEDFYRAFEDRYRGSRELIKTRLKAYLPFVLPLLKHYPGARGLDLGCGRGEWLELLAAHGFAIEGVDLDDGMLEACFRLGLSARKGDALLALQALPDASQVVVSAFHFVEHIDNDLLRELVAQALRVLVPGGLLIMETPNPENVVVAGCNFYLDPSHHKPIPSEYLSFIAENSGFLQAKVVRLQEPAMLRPKDAHVSLLSVLNGVSPDYAIIAQKAGTAAVIQCNAVAFEKEYGLSLRDLADRYEQHVESRLAQTEARLEVAEAALQQSQQAVIWPVEIYRRVREIVRWPTKSDLKKSLKWLLRRVGWIARRVPGLKPVILAVLDWVPHQKRPVAYAMMVQRMASTDLPVHVEHLSVRARQIHDELKRSYSQARRGG